MTAEVVPVSVVIPCYRCARTVERAVASVAAQTAQPLELILVDDGNTDETRNILVALRDRYAPGWLKLVLLAKNVGAASARNAGWEQALGRFVAFLDADDSWHPRKVELQYQFMLSRADVAVSGHGHAQLGQETAIPRLGKGVFHVMPDFYVLLKNPFITPSFMVRRDLAIRFLTGRRHMEDHLFLMQVTLAGLRIAKTKLPLAFIYKNIYGEAGLSADLWVMQKGELANYRFLYRETRISHATFLFFRVYSWIKFLRRLLIVRARNVIGDHH
ncbi:MAG: glycosyltransferase family 2 protein [Polaromonas sp.]